MTYEYPDCIKCEHYNKDKDGFNFTCKAYPNGIPEDIRLGKKHNKIRSDQKGNFIFKKVEDK